MSYCQKCGSELGTDTKFCPECGAPAESKSKAMPEPTSTDGKTLKRTGEPVYGVLNLEDLSPGHLIDDRYEIKEKLGQGGFGAVYRAFDRNMDVDKALKVLPVAIAEDKEAMLDLRTEAQSMVKLNHPNIVRVYDFHETGAIKYIDMEYIDGQTLTDIKLEYPDKRVPEDKVSELALQMVEGLAYAHSKGVIHKDIKPQNIMVNHDGQVKIMDFGIAETVRTSMSRIAQTSSSGTLVYMSPEQVRGKNVGKETDIYSFGVVLYELLSGCPPFYQGDIQYQILNEAPEKIEGVSPELNAVLLKCLAKEYTDRYSTTEKIIKAFGTGARGPVRLRRDLFAGTSIFLLLIAVTFFARRVYQEPATVESPNAISPASTTSQPQPEASRTEVPTTRTTPPPLTRTRPIIPEESAVELPNELFTQERIVSHHMERVRLTPPVRLTLMARDNVVIQTLTGGQRGPVFNLTVAEVRIWTVQADLVIRTTAIELLRGDLNGVAINLGQAKGIGALRITPTGEYEVFAYASN